MAYSKTVWNDLAPPAINAENLNKIEQGIEDAHNLVDNLTLGGITENRPTTPKLYQCYFDSTLGIPVWWNGASWVDASGNNA